MRIHVSALRSAPAGGARSLPRVYADGQRGAAAERVESLLLSADAADAPSAGARVRSGRAQGCGCGCGKWARSGRAVGEGWGAASRM
eukprot:935082-Pleurochrysis_carterae.AAC.1